MLSLMVTEFTVLLEPSSRGRVNPAIAGVRVLSFELSEPSSSPEVARSRLVRQETQALLLARQSVAVVSSGTAEGAGAGRKAE